MFFVVIVVEGLCINLSLKGMDIFCVIDVFICVYLDLIGSGNEIVVYIKYDGWIIFMFNSFG